MSSASQNEGRQSPPPERQTGPQLHETPASGQGTDKIDNKEQTNEDQLKNLTSNPAGIMDAALGEKFAKGYEKK
ncbi:hypothetical protein EKO27_g11795 [Xylaria grammica]|uniref:Uncharacterized protein n=1 Tax=Xylaria grammica TaxID=363999 RepID=A0A439CMK6_9PEZI|nr:hypothetical protein F5X98DRAFT_310487 [Xylaria grammica]RWA03310.1 hypothetical protein EKO27_g11795 [Xylaria grammica]GAW24795.1 hypothetical protein ANO14919_143890 [Xylariales sp. No.14919]